MMRQLIRKDWRVYRIAVAGGAAMVACPYAMLLAMEVLYPPAGGNTLRTYGSALQESSTAGALLTLVLAAVFGGVAFAAERRDRSAEFMAMLPVPRGRVVLSKLLVAVPCLALTAAIHLCLRVIGTRWRHEIDWPPLLLKEFAEGVMLFACVAVLFFGLAWMLSLYLHSPALAASVAIGVATLLYFWTAAWAEEYIRLQRPGQAIPDGYVEATLGAMSVAVGSLALAGSTAHYLRRVRP